MPLKIDVRCNQCAQLLFKKHVPGRRGSPQYGGVEIICPNCKSTNLVGIKEPPVSADPIPYGERRPIIPK